MDSILTSVKKLLGLTEEYTAFDPDIIMHINSVFMIMNQMGVGPAGGFSIGDATATWSEFMADCPNIEAVKSYVALKVRMLFDPPQSSALIDSANRLLSELEWRINVSVDPKD